MELSYQKIQAQSQKQKLILSKQMRESLKILQMPLPELQQKIEHEVLENPVLEYDESFNSSADDIQNESDNIEFAAIRLASEGEKFQPCASPFSSLSEMAYPSDVNWRAPDFRSFLIRQVGELPISPSLEKICRYVIYCLDERGYLTCSAGEIANDLGLQSCKTACEAIHIIQQMEPAGIGAYDLSECLILQLNRKKKIPKATFVIAKQYLNLLAKNKIKTIAQILGISVADAQKCCDIVRNLNPIPSRGYDTCTREKFIIPEVQVSKNAEGVFCVKSLRPNRKKLYINPYYLNLAKATENDETRNYLREKIRRASSLILEITNRKTTIVRIVESILKRQLPYFENGKTFLRPMSMKSIASDVGLNESTVSRAVQDKFILCPFGLVNLKSLFSSAASAHTAEISSVTIKEKIKEIIQKEKKEKPFSDEQIVSLLCQSNMEISRRTVAKYREELSIPSSSERKSYYA